MTIEYQRNYNREWMRRARRKQRILKLMSQGKCIYCEILLKAEVPHNCKTPQKIAYLFEHTTLVVNGRPRPDSDEHQRCF